jgi:hypothetical protein
MYLEQSLKLSIFKMLLTVSDKNRPFQNEEPRDPKTFLKLNLLTLKFSNQVTNSSFTARLGEVTNHLLLVPAYVRDKKSQFEKDFYYTE